MTNVLKKEILKVLKVKKVLNKTSTYSENIVALT